MLYDNNAASFLLGGLCNNPFLCISDKYRLDKTDFYNKETKEGQRLHSIVFVVCKQLAINGVEDVTGADIREFLQAYKSQLECFEESNGAEFVDTIKNLGTSENIEQYYDVVKKFSILREYKANGFDISEIFDESVEFEDQRANINDYSIEDIVNFFEEKLINIKKKFYQDKTTTEYKIGADMMDIVDSFRQEPMYGATTISDRLNAVTRGLLEKQLTIMSMPSGNGKSCVGVATLAKICAKRIYDSDLKKFVDNKYYRGKAGLYIQFEMDDKTELSPRFLGAISGVPTKHIIDGDYYQGEYERVCEAIEVFEESNIYIITMPNFTVTEIDAKVKEYALTKNVGYFVFDYISAQASVNSEISKANKVLNREDQTLAAISSSLKDIAVKYNVAVLTFTQTNANIFSQKILDAGCIAGSRAVQNKADVGMIVLEPRSEEKPYIDMYKPKFGFDPNLECNRIIHTYKVRFGSYEQGIKIWGNLNLSTGEWTDMFVTNKFNEPVEVDSIKLVGEN